MFIEHGTALYRYIVRGNKFYVHEGIVNECFGRKRVIFNDGGFRHGAVRCPRPEDIGVIRHIGPSLWLAERDDELAKQIYVDYMEHKLHKLEKQVADKKEIIRMLKGVNE